MRVRSQGTIPRRLLSGGLGLLGASVLLMACAPGAFAGAWWRLSSRSAPTFLIPGEKATIVIAATNLGDASVNATTKPVAISDILPSGLEATEIRGEPAFHKEAAHLMACELSTLSCTSKAETLPAFEQLDIIITVNVKQSASTGEQNQASVYGGEQEGQPGVEVPTDSVSKPLTVGGQSTPFGVEENGYTLRPEEEGGGTDTQAGSHPFQLTTTLDLNQTLEENPQAGPTQSAPALPKNLQFNLPPGLIGDPRAVTPCPTVDFLAISEAATNACRPQSAVGVVVVTLDEPAHFGDITRAVPLWNLEPARGEPARFGFEALKVPVVLDTSLRSSGDYGVTVSVSDAPQAAQILSSEVTIWGSPGEPSHDQSRGWACLLGGVYFNHEVPCQPPSERSTTAFLTLPTACSGALFSSVEGQSWPVKGLAGEAGQMFSLQGDSTQDELHGFDGCERLPFSPSLVVEPIEEDGETSIPQHAASAPAGLDVDVITPQQSTLEPGMLGEADIKSTSVTLPLGVQLSPSAANGLEACSEQQIGFEGSVGEDPFSPAAPAPLRFSDEPAGCPGASQVGSVRIRTPLLENELQGAVYLASPAPLGEPAKNPFNALLVLYIVAEDPASGIRVKLAGETKLSESTGQLTTTFLDTPQVPFEELKLHLFGGPRAPVSTPPLCGTYPTMARFGSWSGTGLETSALAAQFAITSGPEGTPCVGAQPFVPSIKGGSTSLQAGAFTDFSLQVTRPGADQELAGVTVHLPVGNAAILASVTPCPEPQASLGTCGPQSEIGQATASAGLGPDPYTITGGRVYITGPYAGAPFGLSIVTPAVAGPFDLGNVVVRSAISIDPHTAAVTITTGLPTIVQGVGRAPTGIPLQLRQVYVTVDRPGFEFNPTSCNPMQIEAVLAGAEGAAASAASPFQVANCASLPFKPRLTASTKGQASKADGANFDVKVESKGLGQANIAKVRLQLPKALPARLTTLQKACTEKAFAANPASCPEGSVIGQATIHTPVLRSPLTGPAYLVSHGGAAFPDVEFVLQGEGITLVLDGKTQIKKQVTYSKFESAPDAPFTVFETVLPAGPHSALTTNLPEKAKFNLCSSSLSMPTEIVGQNGAVLKQTTKIALRGCKTVKDLGPKKLTRAQQLKRALAACHKQHERAKAKRAACEKRARKRYAAKRASRDAAGKR